jgi:beta-phosphoglucomutase family hydrolase
VAEWPAAATDVTGDGVTRAIEWTAVTWTTPAGTAALIFDCDGTLADTMPVHFTAWRAMLQPYGIAFPEDVFYALAGMPSTKIVARLAAEQGIELPSDAIDQMVVDKEQGYVATITSVQPIEPVVAVARAARGVLPMAVASGGHRWVVRKTLEAIGVGDWFDALVGAEDTERHKPEPDVFLEAARRLGVAPEGCVVFEDAEFGLEAARRAGMTGIDIRAWL